MHRCRGPAAPARDCNGFINECQFGHGDVDLLEPADVPDQSYGMQVDYKGIRMIKKTVRKVKPGTLTFYELSSHDHKL